MTNNNEEQAPEILSVSVAEDLKPGDAIGNAPPEVPVITRYVPWHQKLSREVTEGDIQTVLKESPVLGKLCHTPVGVYGGANAVSHPQIDDKDPLRFFVSSSGEVIINPVIIEHTKTPVDSVEACTSFPEKPPVTVQRYHKIKVKFQQLTLEKNLSEPREEDFSGPEAKALQHEIAHMNGHSIYDEAISPEDALGQALLTATPTE